MKHSPEVNYAMMRSALDMFGQAKGQLDEAQRVALLQRVNREMAIGKRLLNTEIAAGVVIPAASVQSALDTLRARFDSEADFERAMADNDLDLDGLKLAIAYELKIEAVLEQLFKERGGVSDAEVEIYYYQHLERFSLPETRTARHILLTINDAYVENRREQVERRITAIARELAQSPERFATLAARHSECPTAMQEGLLGRVRRGQLYPELDRLLFSMQEGEISVPVETEVGKHILKCDKIHAAGKLPFEDVRDRLRQILEQKKQKLLLQEWLQHAP